MMQPYSPAIADENRRRNMLLYRPYDPALGVGCCGDRISVAPRHSSVSQLVPRSMTVDPGYSPDMPHDEWVRLRCRHDFEFWAATCVTIRDKTTGRDMPFILNVPQRRVAAILEADRLAARPLRLIMLKARQWGGSTLIQMYMAWIQTCLTTNWHSLICAHVKDTSATIRGMFSKMLDSYPPAYWQGSEPPAFRPFERSVNIRSIEGRGCRVTIASSENHDSVRGADYAMAHLSEVAFWKDSPSASPEMFIRAICGAINYTPLTLIALESTANGIGNYFHREWIRSEAGESDKRAVFVPWHEIEIYRRHVDDPEAVWNAMDPYERSLWDRGLTLEMIAWFQLKRREYPSLKMMLAEYPSTAAEAFTTTGHDVFASDDVEPMRSLCCRPAATGSLHADAVTGVAALRHIRFVPHPDGRMQIWSYPAGNDPSRYIVAVDIGGRSVASDWSVIAVLDRHGGPDGLTPEIAAQWRGHVDHDILAWKSAQMARYYCDALLVFESNTLETEATDGDHSLYILNEIRRHYPRL